ncbi:MAG: RsmB/NOP family class I SAM-dependent RNA methyltransferase [Spirochaetes bacterium]|uniref:NOL1/NOP2/Sun domain family member 4 n=1 Tax=Candidatus Aphodenecus pullistercoris TaxID=2840669 RepID=A0A9D9H9K0_9SPIR|nr:RsmB/NOP family class I SAM-dependent RNA methyltransferase [Candidatus Aphodenecus pullistercoris]
MGRKDEERRQRELEKRSQAFDSYYEAIYKDRWQTLKAALTKEKETVAFSTGLTKAYMLDEASIIAALSLPVAPGDRVLDMCAAPGGKSLVILSRLSDGGLLVANDRSRERKIRLDRVLDEHLDQSRRALVQTSCRDASTWGLKEKEAYDAILLDAPCSSERHVIQSAQHLAMWSPSRPKRLAIEQYSLLASAFMALRKGGHLLYSTCSVNPQEDEAVVAKLFTRQHGLVEEIMLDNPRAEKREHGYIIMPDSSGGLGPLYYCLLRKI